MNIAILFGDRSQAIVEKVSVNVDNVSFFVEDSIDSLIKTAHQRRIFFERVLLTDLSNEIDYASLEQLNIFIREASSDTKVLFVTKQDATSADKVKNLLDIFKSDNFTPVLLADKVTVAAITECCTQSLPEIRAKYFTLERPEVQTQVANYIAPPPPPAVVQQPVAEEKKKGLFGRKKTSGTEEPPSANMPTAPPVLPPPTNAPTTPPAFPSLPAPVGYPVNPQPQVGYPAPAPNPAVGFPAPPEPEAAPPAQPNDGSPAPMVPAPTPDQSENSGRLSEVVEELDEDNLSLGALGGFHTETGVLDDYPLQPPAPAPTPPAPTPPAPTPPAPTPPAPTPPAKTYENPVGSVPLVTQQAEPTPPPVQSQTPADAPPSKLNLPPRKVTVLTSLSMVDVVKRAFSLVKEFKAAGENIIVVDCDGDNKALLGALNAKNFLKAGGYFPVSQGTVYTEGGVDFLTPGYGVGNSLEDYTKLITGSVLRSYDRVIIITSIYQLVTLKKLLTEANTVFCSIDGGLGLKSLLNMLDNRQVVDSEVAKCLETRTLIEVVGSVNLPEIAAGYLPDRVDWLRLVR